MIASLSLNYLNAFAPAPLSIRRGLNPRAAQLSRKIRSKFSSPRRVSVLKLKANTEKQDDEWRKFEEGVQQFQQGLQQLQSGLGLAAEGALNSLGKSALINVERLLGKEELIGRLEAAQSVVLKNIGIGEVTNALSLNSLVDSTLELMFRFHMILAPTRWKRACLPANRFDKYEQLF